MTELAKLAMAKKPEDFKEAVKSELQTRVLAAINDVRADVVTQVFGEEMSANKDELADKKPKVSTTPQSAPVATNPGAMGHEQTDEKKTGSKKAAEPKANPVKEEKDMEDEGEKDGKKMDKGAKDDDKEDMKEEMDKDESDEEESEESDDSKEEMDEKAKK